MIDNYDFSKFQFGIDGINNTMSDLDFYDQIKKAVKKAKFDVNLQFSYFKKNSFLTRFMSAIPSEVSQFCFDMLT